jgi:Zn-dependent protease with chaperone function
MTATRMGRVATLAGAAIVWFFAAALLWRTTVPADLKLPSLDERATFGAELVRDAENYERFYYILWFVATVVALAMLAWLVRRGPRLASSLRLGRVNAGIITGVVVTTILWAVSLPFSYASAWWDRRHGISVESWGLIAFQPWVELLATTFQVFLILAVLLILAKRFARHWWVGGAAVILLLAILLQLGFPYLERLDSKAPSPQLAATIDELERREGTGDLVVRVQDVGDQTTAANAYTFGIGPSRTVVLWSTLLDGRFTRDEVRFVAAHELAHQARNHLWKGIAWGTLIGLPLLAAVAFVTGRRGGLRNPGTVPLALLTLTVAQLALTPFENAVSRRYEAEADWTALKATRDPDAAKGLFIGFVEDLSDPEPPAWTQAVFGSHPSPLERVEMAEAFRRR